MAPRYRIGSQTSQDEIPPVAPSDTSSLTDEKVPYKPDDDKARHHHDLFNILALVVVIGVTVPNWDLTKLHRGVHVAYTGNYFVLNWVITLLYFLIDLIWVATIPGSVKSPSTIIKHHIIAMAYLSAPTLWPEYQWAMGVCLSVEINTWFLILRRVLYKQNASEFWRTTVGACFYISWIAIRIFVYPAMFIMFCVMAMERFEQERRLLWPMMFIPVHGFLCVLNLKWSYDLFLPMFTTKSAKIASGL